MEQKRKCRGEGSKGLEQEWGHKGNRGMKAGTSVGKQSSMLAPRGPGPALLQASLLWDSVQTSLVFLVPV